MNILDQSKTPLRLAANPSGRSHIFSSVSQKTSKMGWRLAQCKKAVSTASAWKCRKQNFWKAGQKGFEPLPTDLRGLILMPGSRPPLTLLLRGISRILAPRAFRDRRFLHLPDNHQSSIVLYPCQAHWQKFFCMLDWVKLKEKRSWTQKSLYS